MKIKIEWSEEARADVRRLDKPSAMRVFQGLLRYIRASDGDVRALQGDLAGRYRLRIGNYRVCFTRTGHTLQIHWVRHRSNAYR